MYAYSSFSSQEHGMQVKKMLYVPRVEDKNSHMRMLRISNIEDLVANSMDILEPSPVDADQNERADGKLSNNKGFCSSHFMVILRSLCWQLNQLTSSFYLDLRLIDMEESRSWWRVGFKCSISLLQSPSIIEGEDRNFLHHRRTHLKLPSPMTHILTSECCAAYPRYYDVFLRKYEELANQQKWKQPLRGTSFSTTIILNCIISKKGVVLASSCANM
ncbi:hypothetical protein B296_00055139 [Ensete ventricosum]|uniref:5-formyltetrahydrofolate cyclo-ligase n=1 Tax=Ensete ventricosum TaxID=4639 RepID=A0A426X1G0_ENSVE|nr:hypothetical protein B296_00055139 [Ensete ventricosum]